MEPSTDLERRADAITGTAVLNCLRREVTAVEGGLTTDDTHVTIRLPRAGIVLRARHGRWASEPERLTGDVWSPLTWRELAGAVCQELTLHTGVAADALVAEITDSRTALEAMLRARVGAAMPDELYQRSEQALVAGHRYHPAPKGRGGIAAEHWLPYAPEAHASFPLSHLAVREDVLVDDGDTAALSALGADVPDGYRLLPAHPWQLTLLQDRLCELPALRDGRLRALGAGDRRVWPTSSVRTVCDPAADLFYKFSLDVRITNDVRRLWLYDLRWTAPLARVLRPAFADVASAFPGTAFLIDRGYRTIDVGDVDVYEGLAVVVRDGVRAHTLPGVTPLLTAGISEGFPGNPLDGLDAAATLTWWRRYLATVVPPVLHMYFRHGVVLECHLQNVLVGVGPDGMPVQALFRDHEGVRLLASRHAGLLREVDGPHSLARGVDAEHGWQRLQYCLVTNHLHEIAGAIIERHPALAQDVWAEARGAFVAYGRDHGAPGELRELLDSPQVPSKTNLLLRWFGADGAASTYVAHPNPLLTGS
ncbi:IucA/IucC family protein [Amycolatopsis sp. NPDC059657]|uniref:IucA/IucC family protein n=1 Tax=Amycolatopsis sp. NPDC059657 TaxID=3346899 RepID=UPI00366D0755